MYFSICGQEYRWSLEAYLDLSISAVSTEMIWIAGTGTARAGGTSLSLFVSVFLLTSLQGLSKFTMKWSKSHSVVSNSLQPHGLHSPCNSPGQNSGVGSCSLLQGIFPTQGLNPGLLHCRLILYQLSHREAHVYHRLSKILHTEGPDFSNKSQCSKKKELGTAKPLKG